MSLLRPVIRAVTVAALRDRTWAEDRVFDTDNTPLGTALTGDPDASGVPTAKPYITVYTDTDDIPRVTGTELYNGEDRQLSIVVEIGVASAIKGINGEITLQFSATDEGMELAVDVIDAQVRAALFGDPNSSWGELFKRLVYRVQRLPSRRGGQSASGVRFAARRLTFQCSTISDIPPGVVPQANHPIMDFIKMSQMTPISGMLDVGKIISGLLTVDAAPTWRQAQAYMGMSKRAIRHLNPDGTPLPFPNVETPPLDWSDTNEFVPALTDIEFDAGSKVTIPEDVSALLHPRHR